MALSHRIFALKRNNMELSNVSNQHISSDNRTLWEQAVKLTACPSCGRTRFNIQKALADVQAATGHLKNLTIGVMGCIVNGPGEMIDADFGYVGAGNALVALYKGRGAGGEERT